MSFHWEARFPIAPLLSIRVLDGYADGEGMLQVRALGIPIQRQSGPEIAVGEAYRYLAELPWVPHAMAYKHELEWREADERHVEVATRVGDVRPTVRLMFNDAGDIVRSCAEARPRNLGAGSVPTS